MLLYPVPCVSCVVLRGRGELAQPRALWFWVTVVLYLSLCVSSVVIYMIALDFGGLTAAENTKFLEQVAVACRKDTW